MSEVEALMAIADAIKALAAAVGSVGTALWLMLFFKNMGGKG